MATTRPQASPFAAPKASARLRGALLAALVTFAVGASTPACSGDPSCEDNCARLNGCSWQHPKLDCPTFCAQATAVDEKTACPGVEGVLQCVDNLYGREQSESEVCNGYADFCASFGRDWGDCIAPFCTAHADACSAIPLDLLAARGAP